MKPLQLMIGLTVMAAILWGCPKSDSQSAKPTSESSKPASTPSSNPTQVDATAKKGPHGGFLHKEHDHVVEYVFDSEKGEIKAWVLEHDASLLDPSVVITENAAFTIAVDPVTKQLTSTGNNVNGFVVQDEFLKGAKDFTAKFTVKVTDHGPEPIDHPFRFSYPPVSK